MKNMIKFTILLSVLSCYVWYLNSLQTTVTAELSQLSNVYAHAGEIATQSSQMPQK